MARVRPSSLDRYLKQENPEYETVFATIALKLANEKIEENTEIQTSTGYPIPLLNHFLDLLEERGLIKMNRTYHGYRRIFHISPELKRKFQ